MKCFIECNINESEKLIDDNNKVMNLKNLGFNFFFSDKKKNRSTLFSFPLQTIYISICIIIVIYVSFMDVHMNDGNVISDSISVSLVERNLSEYYIGKYGAMLNYYIEPSGVYNQYYSGRHTYNTYYDALDEDLIQREEDSNDSEEESEGESENESDEQSENDSEEESEEESEVETENESEEESDDEPVKKKIKKNKQLKKNEEKKDIKIGNIDSIQKTLNNIYTNKNNVNDSNNNFNAPLKNLNYNDITRQLNEHEITEVITGLKDITPRTDLINVWIQTLGVCKLGWRNIINTLKDYEKECLSKYKKIISPHYGGTPREKYPEEYWKECLYNIEFKFLNVSSKYNKTFYELLNRNAEVDKIKIFLFSCLEEFDNLKIELCEEYKNELYKKIMKVP